MNHEKNFIREWWSDEDDKSFILKVRLHSIWDEEHFLRMEQTANRMLDALQADPSQREHWRYTFTERIEMIAHLLSHPGFLAENDLSMSKDQYKEYIGHRIERLEALRKRYEALT